MSEALRPFRTAKGYAFECRTCRWKSHSFDTEDDRAAGVADHLRSERHEFEKRKYELSDRVVR